MSTEFEPTASELARVDENRFTSDIEALIKNAEQHRLDYMRKFRGREVMSMTLGLVALLIGASGFGWFLLVEANIVKAVASMILAIILPIVLQLWSDGPIKDYVVDHKRSFMPQMAKALGGFKFHPSRGISSKIISKTGIIPAYDEYKAEDCFVGVYKGVKVIFSEARLNLKKRKRQVFHGIFVLLEIPQDILEGHTIVTADKKMVERYAGSRWSKLSPVQVETSNPSWSRFDVFSDKPETAKLLAGDKLLKELAEASDIFDTSPLSAVFFRGKYIFLSIPYDKDMFEASDIYVPVTTKEHALSCKKEIEQILEIIDVFEIYQTPHRKP